MTPELHATPEEVMRAVEALRQFGEARQVPAKTLFGLTLALEECASNIVNHALGRDPCRTFQASFQHRADELVIELLDDGPPFDPSAASAPVPATAADDDPPGGWGILLVRRYTDAMHYSRVGNTNLLRLTKKFGTAA